MILECPKCGSLKCYRTGKIVGKQRYVCRDCGKTFYKKEDYAESTKERSKWLLW